MKSLLKLLVSGVALSAVAPLAHADTLNQISYTGDDAYCTVSTGCTVQSTNGTSFSQNYGDVTFVDTTKSKTSNETAGPAYGIFAPFGNAKAQFTDFNYLTTGTPFDLISETVGSGSSKQSLTFTVTDLSYTLTDNGKGTQNLEVMGGGYYTLTTSSGTVTIPNGTFDLTTQYGGVDSVVTFSDTNAITPEPSSLLLLGTGLMGAAALLFQRRRMGSASVASNIA